jgi:hypothetical protein
MRKRCFDTTSPQYKHYGGRGIIVCDEWRLSFEAFFSHIGPVPTDKHQVDRFPNNDGDYEPGNVRWATSGEQARNKRNNSWYLVDGQHRMVGSDATKFLGKKPNTCIIHHPRVKMLENTYRRYDVLEHLQAVIESCRSSIEEHAKEMMEEIRVAEAEIKVEKERRQRIADKVAASNRRYEEAKTKMRAASA